MNRYSPDEDLIQDYLEDNRGECFTVGDFSSYLSAQDSTSASRGAVQRILRDLMEGGTVELEEVNPNSQHKFRALDSDVNPIKQEYSNRSLTPVQFRKARSKI